MPQFTRKIYRLMPEARSANSAENSDHLWFVDSEEYQYIGVYDPDKGLMNAICGLLGASYIEITITEKAFKAMLQSQGILQHQP